MLIGSYSHAGYHFALWRFCVLYRARPDRAYRYGQRPWRYLWTAGGAFAMGIGVWLSMHFIGMLAFNLPIDLGYDFTITLLSPLTAILSCGFALRLVSQPRLPAWQLAFGALVMGAGISAMHYTGMAAMRMQPVIDYNPTLFGTLRY